MRKVSTQAEFNQPRGVEISTLFDIPGMKPSSCHKQHGGQTGSACPVESARNKVLN